MRLYKLGFFLVAIQAGLPFAYAQQTKNVAPPPPQMERLEEGHAPAATIEASKVQPDSMSQRRVYGGKVTESKVTSGGSTYYVLPNDQVGSSVGGDMESHATRPAQWEILHFGGDKENRKAAEAASRTPAPPETK
jgi:hypothetical protein